MASETPPPQIAAQLHHLALNCPLLAKIEPKWSGSKDYSGVLDRFTLVISYCLDFIKWDVIFDAEYPMSAPDVIFGPDDESFQQYLVMNVEDPKSVMNRLGDWDSRDPTQLMVLVQELRDQYMAYQTKCVGEVQDDRVKFEISTIAFREGIEMHLSSGFDKPEEVKFSVPLVDTNINKMVPGCPWIYPQKIYLQVIYPVEKKYVSTPSAPRLRLVATPNLKSLFSIDDFKLPTWLTGMCMAEYLPPLEEILEKQVAEAVSLIDVRRLFIEALAGLFGRPVEAEPIFCRRATFLTASRVFTFLVHFTITTQFPKQPPVIMLQSVQHCNPQGVPVRSMLLTDYPFSPRWEALVMAEQIWDFLADEALIFKKYCNDSISTA